MRSHRIPDKIEQVFRCARLVGWCLDVLAAKPAEAAQIGEEPVAPRSARLLMTVARQSRAWDAAGHAGAAQTGWPPTDDDGDEVLHPGPLEPLRDNGRRCRPPFLPAPPFLRRQSQGAFRR